jgi:outer membrane protein assembly factor BamB
LAGNYLFLQTPDAQLVAIRGIDGMMPWIVPLISPDGKATSWRGPVVAGNAVWLVNNRGKLVSFDPQTGKVRQSIDVADDMMTTPVIADKSMYLVDEDAKLYLIK